MKKRMLSLILCLVMVLSLMPTVAFAASGSYIIIGGTRYEDTDFTALDGTVTYNNAERTLTLNNANITQADDAGSANTCCIYIHISGSVTIKLIGTNTISINAQDQNVSALDSWSIVTIDGGGNGSLTVTATGKGSTCLSAIAASTLTIRNATVTATAENTSDAESAACFGIKAYPLVIDNAEVTASAKSEKGQMCAGVGTRLAAGNTNGYVEIISGKLDASGWVPIDYSPANASFKISEGSEARVQVTKNGTTEDWDKVTPVCGSESPYSGLIAEVEKSTAPKIIESLNVNVTAPVVGNHPDLNPVLSVTPNEAASLCAIYLTPEWICADRENDLYNGNYTVMTSTDTFEAGKYYAFSVQVNTQPAIDAGWQRSSAIVTTINGAAKDSFDHNVLVNTFGEDIGWLRAAWKMPDAEEPETHRLTGFDVSADINTNNNGRSFLENGTYALSWQDNETVDNTKFKIEPWGLNWSQNMTDERPTGEPVYGLTYYVRIDIRDQTSEKMLDLAGLTPADCELTIPNFTTSCCSVTAGTDSVSIVFKLEMNPTNYPIWVSGEQVTEANKTDVLGDGKVSYDPATKTLSVADGAKITGVYTRDEYVNALIYSDGIDLIIDAPAGLTLNNNTGYGVYSRFNDNNEYGSLTVKGNVTGTVAQSVLFASKGVTVNGDVDLTHTATNGSYPIEANGGDLTITGKAKFSAAGSCNRAVYCGGSITVGGDVTVEGSFKHGLYATGNLEVTGNVTATVAESALCATKAVTVNGDVDITHTGTDGRYPIEANDGDVKITRKAKFNATGSCNEAVFACGSITVGDDVTIEGSFKRGLYAFDGNTEVKGNVTATVTESALCATKAVTVNGDVDITHTGTAGEYLIVANEDVNIDGKAKFNAAGSCRRPVHSGGSITVGGDVTVEGSFTNGLYASNKVTVVSGTWDIDVSECAIEAAGEIIIPGTHEITTPVGGKVGIKKIETIFGFHDQSVITDADGNIAEHVVIAPGAVTVTGVSLNKTSVSMKVGATETLTATVTPDDAANKNVTWTSSDESVATVADGVVTAVSEGTATIKVTTEDGGFTATCTVTVTKKSSGGGGGSISTYPVTIESSKNGNVTADVKTAAKGDKVTLTVNPAKGYTLETIIVTDKDGKELKLTEKGGKFTFTMPASKATVKATFMEDNTMLNYFVDVTASDYYYDAVLWAAENGITGGVDAVHFAPNSTCTRAQAVTFLWRAAGCPEVAVKDTFGDVVKGSYYEKAVAWAVAQGITKGTSETTFDPNGTCTRGQIVTFLYRANKVDTLNIKVNPFTDVLDGAYYYDAVLWAVERGITKGTTDTTFSPNNNCTRAQIVTFLYRYMV